MDYKGWKLMEEDAGAGPWHVATVLPEATRNRQVMDWLYVVNIINGRSTSVGKIKKNTSYDRALAIARKRNSSERRVHALQH